MITNRQQQECITLISALRASGMLADHDKDVSKKVEAYKDLGYDDSDITVTESGNCRYTNGKFDVDTTVKTKYGSRVVTTTFYISSMIQDSKTKQENEKAAYYISLLNNCINAGKTQEEQKKEQPEPDYEKEAREWVEKNGSKLARLRAKYNFSFVCLAATEKTKSLIASGVIKDELGIMNPKFYDALKVANSETHPPLKVLQKYDDIKEQYKDFKFSLEYNNDYWFIILHLEFFNCKVYGYIKIAK